MLCALAFGEQADRLDFLSRVWSALLRGVWASSKPNDRELRVGHVSSRRLSPARVHHQVARNSCNNYQILCSYFGLVRPAQAFNSSAMLGNWHISLIIVIIINLSANVASSKYIQKKAKKKWKKKNRNPWALHLACLQMSQVNIRVRFFIWMLRCPAYRHAAYLCFI